MTLQKPLTKTLFVSGIRCPRLLYYLYYKPNEIPKDSLGTDFRKKQGNLVGEVIKGLFPEAVDISREPDQIKLILTKENKEKIIFEASVQYNNLFARADVLFPNQDGTYDIIEVKSDTKVKDEHIPDVSFQKYVFQKAGYNINKCYLLHINNDYVREGELNLEQLYYHYIEFRAVYNYYKVYTLNFYDGIRTENKYKIAKLIDMYGFSNSFNKS